MNHGWQSEATDGAKGDWGLLSFSLFLSLSLIIDLSICLSIYLSIYLSIHLSIYVSFCLSIYLAIYLSVYLSIYLCIFLSVYLSIYLCIFLSIYLSVYLSICLSIYLSNCLSVYLSICLSVYLSICLSIYLSIFLSIYLSIYLSKYLSVYLSICLSVYPSICLFVYLSFCLSVYRSICLSAYLSIYLSICLSVYLSTFLSARLKTELFCESSFFSKLTTSKTQQFCKTSSFFKVDNIKNEAILRDFLIFRRWQHQKRNNSAGLLHFLNWTTSKTKQFCETSSICEFDNIKNKWFLRGFLQKWKVECRADSLVPMRLAMFPVHLSKVLYLPRESDARSYEVLPAPVTQNHLSKPEDLMLQNATHLRKSAPWPPNISDEHVFCTAPATRNASLKILFKCPTPAIAFGNSTKPSRFAHFRQSAQSLAPATRNGIWTSKSGPNPCCL